MLSKSTPPPLDARRSDSKEVTAPAIAVGGGTPAEPLARLPPPPPKASAAAPTLLLKDLPVLAPGAENLFRDGGASSTWLPPPTPPLRRTDSTPD